MRAGRHYNGGSAFINGKWLAFIESGRYSGVFAAILKADCSGQQKQERDQSGFHNKLNGFGEKMPGTPEAQMKPGDVMAC